jgi:hypothetical protein
MRHAHNWYQYYALKLSASKPSSWIVWTGRSTRLRGGSLVFPAHSTNSVLTVPELRTVSTSTLFTSRWNRSLATSARSLFRCLSNTLVQIIGQSRGPHRFSFRKIIAEKIHYLSSPVAVLCKCDILHYRKEDSIRESSCAFIIGNSSALLSS